MAMNPFVKAAILTVAVTILALLIVSQLDGARANELRRAIDAVTFESESTRVLARMGSVLGTGGDCDFLSNASQLQKDKAYSLALQIQDYQRSNILGENYESLKHAYFVSLADLYLSTLEQSKACPAFAEHTLVLYYSEKDCPDCRAQNQVLEQMAGRCSNVRIFAFPTDTNYPFLNLLERSQKVSFAPTLVIDQSRRLEGLLGDAQIISALKGAGAQCS